MIIYKKSLYGNHHQSYRNPFGLENLVLKCIIPHQASLFKQLSLSFCVSLVPNANIPSSWIHMKELVFLRSACLSVASIHHNYNLISLNLFWRNSSAKNEISIMNKLNFALFLMA